MVKFSTAVTQILAAALLAALAGAAAAQQDYPNEADPHHRALPARRLERFPGAPFRSEAHRTARRAGPRRQPRRRQHDHRQRGRGEVRTRWLHAAPGGQQPCLHSAPVSHAPVRHAQRLHARRRHRARRIDARRASVAAGDDGARPGRAREEESGRPQLRRVEHGRPHASRRRAVRDGGRSEDAAGAVQRRRARDDGSRRRPRAGRFRHPRDLRSARQNGQAESVSR